VKPATSIAFGAVAALGFAYLFIKYDEGDVTLETTLDALGVGKGKRLNNTGGRRGLNADGYIATAPNVLLTEASEVMGYDINPEVYAMARSGRSEGVNGMEARMHVFMTQAEQAGTSVWALTLKRAGYEGDGFFGIQKHRRWASSRDPYERDVLLAEKVYSEHNQGIDPTGGASRFVDKSAFGKQPGTRTYDDVLASWTAEGYEPFSYPDASNDFVLFRKA
jgi:hypothetical protein